MRVALLALFIVIWSGGVGAAGLPIAERLQKHSVLLIGWLHSSSDKIIPKILLDEISKLVQEREPVTLVIEWPDGRAEDFYTWPQGGSLGSLGKTIDQVRNLGVEIVAGDHPHHGEFTSVSDTERERHFAMKVHEAQVRGRKVILVVGKKHLLNIGRQLRLADVVFTSIVTDYNVLTGEVRWNGESLGFTDWDYRFIDGRHQFPKTEWNIRGWGRTYPSPDHDRLFALTANIRTGVRKLCERLIVGRGI